MGFFEGDTLLLRFCGLWRLPCPRTLSRWLRNFKEASLHCLRALNAEVVAQAIRPLVLRTLTTDVDGSVTSTGLQAQGAFPGYNPHQRKAPSYYPITGYVAEIGHILRIKNRSGNVHDSRASITFLRELFGQIGEIFAKPYWLNFRMTGAFFTQEGPRSARGPGRGLCHQGALLQVAGAQGPHPQAPPVEAGESPSRLL